MKDLYKGYFNLFSETMIERVRASSERQAWFLFCKRIAKRRRVPEKNIMQIFDGHRDNFLIQKEMEFEEIEEVENE